MNMGQCSYEGVGTAMMLNCVDDLCLAIAAFAIAPVNSDMTNVNDNLRATLERILPEVRLDNTGFFDAIDFLRDITSANIHVNWSALEVVGINRHTPVSGKFRDITLSKLLNILLADIGMGVVKIGYTADGNVINIFPLDLPSVGIAPSRRFEIALSFPGEYREYVREVDRALQSVVGPEKVFYDERFQSELARPDLDTYLQHIYHNDASLIVVFLCAEYAIKEWCGLEWRAVRDLIKKRRHEDVMFVRMDLEQIEGSFSIDGYIDARSYTPNDLAAFILERVNRNNGLERG